MSNIKAAFEDKKVFIPFLPAGYPSLDLTEELIYTCAANGADAIELGIPFSDPVAEAPIVQRVNAQALSAGVTVDRVFDMLERLRCQTNIPIVLVLYTNVVLSYGEERFLNRCRASGVDGLLILDLPHEEREELHPLCREYGVELICQVAPARRERIASIAKEAEGFVYLSSNEGIRERHEGIVSELSEIIKVVRDNTKLPCVTGFGIQTPEDIQAAVQDTDGVVCDCALIPMLEKLGHSCVEPIGRYIRQLRQATR